MKLVIIYIFSFGSGGIDVFYYLPFYSGEMYSLYSGCRQFIMLLIKISEINLSGGMFLLDVLTDIQAATKL